MQTVELQFCEKGIPCYRHIVGNSNAFKAALLKVPPPRPIENSSFYQNIVFICYVTLTSSYSHFSCFSMGLTLQWLFNDVLELSMFKVKFEKRSYWCKSSLIVFFLLSGLSGGSLSVTCICWILFIQFSILSVCPENVKWLNRNVDASVDILVFLYINWL